MGIKQRFANWLLNNSTVLKAMTQHIGTQELVEAMYRQGGNIEFNTDNMTYSYITDGYEGNADVFSISDRISTYFASVDLIPYKLGTENEVKEDPIKKLFDQNDIDKTYFEFKKEWELFNLISGNTITHTPKFNNGGNMDGQIFKLANLPTQNIKIESGTGKQVIRAYKFTVGDQRIELSPDEIWHSRMFLNLKYDQGRNFMGISPIKVALNIIKAQNSGYNITEKTYKNVLPPAIVSYLDRQKDLTPEERTKLEKVWEMKTGIDKSGKPYFTGGNLAIHKLGYENFRDLQTIENSENGMRILCRVWGVPSELFNDTANRTYNSMKEAKKDMYEGRIIPDINMYLQGLNRLAFYFGIYYKADWTKIAALQQDLKEKATIYDMGIKNRSVLPNEYRTDVLGKDELTDEELERLQMQAEFNNIGNLDGLLEQSRL